MLKVFISSHMSEFKHERKEIKKIIEDLFLIAKLAEHEGTTDKGVNKIIEEWVDECDIYLGIFGYSYSKNTISEFHRAKEQNKTIILLVKECYPSCTIDKRQNAFIEGIKKDGVFLFKDFRETNDLLMRVKHTIINALCQNFNDIRNLPKYFNDNPKLLCNKDKFEFIDLTHAITEIPLTADSKNTDR